MLFVEPGAADVAAADAVLDVCQGAAQVEAEGAPLLAHGVMERAQPAAEGSHKPGQVIPPVGVGGVAPGQPSVTRMVEPPHSSSVTTSGAGR